MRDLLPAVRRTILPFTLSLSKGILVVRQAHHERAVLTCSAHGIAWPAMTPVQRSWSTATWPLTITNGMPMGYCRGSS